MEVWLKMKITDLAIIFILITIPFLITTKIKRDYLHKASEQSILYNRMLDTAIEDAISVYKNDDAIEPDLAKEIFFKTLSVNFEMPDNATSRARLSRYVPAMVSIEKDGFSVLAQKEFTNDNGLKERQLIWQPKEPYAYEKGNYIYRFYLDNRLEIYTKNLNQLYKGSYRSLKDNELLADTILMNEEEYKVIKNRVIIDKIQKELNHHINAYNDFSKTFGIKYEFFLPTIKKGDWENTISDVSLLVFFQGLPIGSQGNYYNNYAVGGSRIIKSKNYYVIKNMDTGKEEYHNQSCEVLKNNPSANHKIFRRKIDAAKDGAFPCTICQ
jgi:hypothetical protein